MLDGSNRALAFYRTGATPFFALQSDQRFSYCLYVPKGYLTDERAYPLVVAVHGTARQAERYRDRFADFAERHGCIVLCPLFPVGVAERDDLNGYKYLVHGGIRYDRILLAMVDELCGTYRLDAERFLLTGFSGGGHFTHRFLYAHPERLLAASIGAPGVVTLLDDSLSWPAGVGGRTDALRLPVDMDAVRDVAVQMVVGADDTEVWEIGVPRGEPLWIEGVNDEGVNRKARMEALKASFEAHGVSVRHDILPGVGHEGLKALTTIQDFFGDVLAGRTPAGRPDAAAAGL